MTELFVTHGRAVGRLPSLADLPGIFGETPLSLVNAVTVAIREDLERNLLSPRRYASLFCCGLLDDNYPIEDVLSRACPASSDPSNSRAFPFIAQPRGKVLDLHSKPNLG